MSVIRAGGKSKGKTDIEKIATICCVAACTLLSFSLLVMSVFYMSMMLKNTSDDTEELPKNIYYRLRGGSKETSGYDMSLCLPVFAGFRVEEYGGFMGIDNNESVMCSFCSALKTHLESVLCEEGSCRKMGYEEGEKLWNGCPSHDNYVYLCFEGDIPDYYVRAFYCSDDEGECSGDIGILHELFLIYEKKQDGDYSLSAIGRSSDGEVWSYVTGISYTLEDIESYYRNSYFSPCEFICNLDEAARAEYALELSDTAIIYEYGKRAESIKIIENKIENTDDEMFELFGYNPNKLNEYTESGDVHVYVESHGTLRVSTDAIVYSAAADGGIALSEITGYTGESYTLYDYVLCCCSVIEKLDGLYPEIFGGEGNTRLVSVKRSDDIVMFEFAYTYSNLGITKNGEQYIAYSLSICSGKLTSLEAHSLCIKGNGNYYVAYPQNWALQRIAESSGDFDGEKGNILLSYEISDTSEEYTANWSYVTENIACDNSQTTSGEEQ